MADAGPGNLGAHARSDTLRLLWRGIHLKPTASMRDSSGGSDSVRVVPGPSRCKSSSARYRAYRSNSLRTTARERLWRGMRELGASLGIGHCRGASSGFALAAESSDSTTPWRIRASGHRRPAVKFCRGLRFSRSPSGFKIGGDWRFNLESIDRWRSGGERRTSLQWGKGAANFRKWWTRAEDFARSRARTLRQRTSSTSPIEPRAAAFDARP